MLKSGNEVNKDILEIDYLSCILKKYVSWVILCI